MHTLLYLGQITGTSLGVQGLGLCAPNAGGPGSIPGQGAGPHMLQLKLEEPASPEQPNKSS